MVCIKCTVFMYLELSLNESQGISLDENRFNGLKNLCCVTHYPFPATVPATVPAILYKFTLNFGQNYPEIRRFSLFQRDFRAVVRTS